MRIIYLGLFKWRNNTTGFLALGTKELGSIIHIEFVVDKQDRRQPFISPLFLSVCRPCIRYHSIYDDVFDLPNWNPSNFQIQVKLVLMQSHSLYIEKRQSTANLFLSFFIPFLLIYVNVLRRVPINWSNPNPLNVIMTVSPKIWYEIPSFIFYYLTFQDHSNL